ncbi:hypothetical protein [Bradyrhizobium sp. HKCCYLS20291]|uniref:hypothetical protein n=1 Tax=Bradyrhizobium sp. HKCCYLS20291 TaxID=3420766 RepID=UPI003EC03485
MAYPTTPGSKTAGASDDAAKLAAPRAGTLRAKVEDLMLKGYRLTSDEIAALLGQSPFAIRPRCTELVNLGVLIKTENRRKDSSGATTHLLRHRDCLTEVPLPAAGPKVQPTKTKVPQEIGRIKRAPAVHADQNALFG